MPSSALRSAHRLARLATICLAGSTLALVIGVGVRSPEGLTGWVVRKSTAEIPWQVFDTDDVLRGETVRPNTHTVFQIPLTTGNVMREVLFGHKGRRTRYWGYCVPQNYDPALVTRRKGLPGLLFLSEKERWERELHAAAQEPTFSLTYLPTKQDLAYQQSKAKRTGIIRHQLDTFEPGHLCYVMSEDALSLGLDLDGDRLNETIEREIGTDPARPDTDGDGINDGIEYLTLTNPAIRDTDGDGLLDGIEDKNWNGEVDMGETDPRTKDSDRDGLCDGICRQRLANRREYYIGEDNNLNGQVDEGETDPLKRDTDGDGSPDDLELFKCLFSGSSNC